MSTIHHFPPPPQLPSIQTQWNRACALAAQGMPDADPARLAKGLALAQAHHVYITDEDERETYADIQSGKTVYTVGHDRRCPCADYEKRPTLLCKHLIALTIHEQALLTKDEQPIEPELDAMPQAQEVVVNEIPALPVPQVVQHVENPAGANFKARIGNAELWYTFHDTTDEAVMARLRLVLPELQEMIHACELKQQEREASRKAEADVQKATADLPGLIAQAVQQAMQAQQRLGAQEARPGGQSNPAFCRVHQVTMPARTSRDGTQTWYSHQLDEVDEYGKVKYCRGGK